MSSGVSSGSKSHEGQVRGRGAGGAMLEPELASGIARKLLQFHYYNRKRQLVDDLIGMGVTTETYHAFTKLCRDPGLSIPEYLVVEVYNLMSHIEKGNEMPSDALHQMPTKRIEVLAQEAATAAAALGAKVPIALSGQKPSRVSKKPR